MTVEKFEAYYERERKNDPYTERHYYSHQTLIEGIPVDPVMRYYFYMTPNDERPRAELNDWWDKPYITVHGFPRDTYKEYLERMGNSDFESEEEFNERKQKELKEWFEIFKDGYRYDVRCLNGGAWDRSLNLGNFDNLEDALALAKSYELR